MGYNVTGSDDSPKKLTVMNSSSNIFRTNNDVVTIQVLVY
jgi:hypothetical protein